ncbi:MAG: undecaprenyl/decaprenyl-phosphate alpha-N-acetylglucosaminyl 1-phosphate transferase [Muribaculaceae bacterium]|nr:undecaprenyl/decaprenyl-phosphate alpha-N-acetylglucosaminyl 1-phosphate transferase [Bacteroides sp.]MDE5848405.1 undecaprenyl/decaprenyl-phosphate alpha-N-acetylglucosaminyl 1-phosphate transferase [Muribaculaceae bacterium]MDE6854981.1 undecaprenyl/decaprenyl-phosphate alpha-N-acetylglucosaminyl 1-phosphate transferase [Muribaculaceae bacterium]
MASSYWIYTDIAVFCVALLLTGIIIPQILLIAFSKKLFDEVDERKIHKGVVPRLGGIAFLPAIIFSICLVLAVNMSCGWSDSIPALANCSQSILYLLCAEMLIFLVGIADDLIGVRYKAKFVCQILCAIFICASGTYIHDLGGILWITDIPGWLGWCVSAFIVVYIVNAINLIDGIDGLASGLSGIALIFYGIVLTQAGEWILALLVWAQLGTLVPFFYYNVFGNPTKRKKIFMGDTGALTVGMLLSFIALSVTNIDAPEVTKDYNQIVLAFSPLIIPAFDVVRVYFHRLRQGRNPFLPDKCHIHHKLLALGLNQRASLCAILLAAVIFMLVNVALSPYVSATWLIVGDVLLWLGSNLLITRAIRRKESRLHTTLYD